MDAGFAELPATSTYSLLDMNGIAVQQSGYLMADLSFEGTTADQDNFYNFKATHALSPIL
jgi:hypothetical protein